MFVHGMFATFLASAALLPVADASSLQKFLQSRDKVSASMSHESSKAKSNMTDFVATADGGEAMADMSSGVFISPPPSSFGGDPQSSKFQVGRTILEVLKSWVIFVVFSIVVYFVCYKNCVTPPEPKEETNPNLEDLQKDFTNGHWLCFEDSEICFCSFCCMPLRWSDTKAQAKMLGFWLAFALIALAILFNGVLAAGPFFTAGLILYYRQQLRKKLLLESGTCNSCCVDFCYAFWCPCCAVAQEARIVKDGIQSGYNFESPNQD